MVAFGETSFLVRENACSRWSCGSMSIELTRVVSVDMSNEPRVLLFCYLFQSVRRLISSARLHHIHGSECPSCPNPQMSSSSR